MQQSGALGAVNHLVSFVNLFLNFVKVLGLDVVLMLVGSGVLAGRAAKGWWQELGGPGRGAWAWLPKAALRQWQLHGGLGRGVSTGLWHIHSSRT